MQKVADNASALPPDVIDIEVFEQLLEMDEEDDRDFSKSLVYNYFEQAESTFENMRKALYVLLLMQCIGGARGTFDAGSLSQGLVGRGGRHQGARQLRGYAALRNLPRRRRRDRAEQGRGHCSAEKYDGTGQAPV